MGEKRKKVIRFLYKRARRQVLRSKAIESLLDTEMELNSFLMDLFR